MDQSKRLLVAAGRGTCRRSTAMAATGALAADKTKIGFVYVGPIGDHGWSYQHHQGLEAIKKEFGDKVETTFVEKVSEGPDAERVIQQLAQKGHKHHLHDVFRLHEPHIEGGETLPQCPLRTFDRLQTI